MAGRIAQIPSGLLFSRGELRMPAFAALLALAWLLAAGQLIAEYAAATAVTLPDADDAMRLVELRKFLSGGMAGWFDLNEPRLGLQGGYDTHWSRLVDAGLAALYLVFRIFGEASAAERWVTIVWPLLLLIPVIGGVAGIAWRIAGREAAIIVLLLALFSGPGIQQFRPGRIDHHNVQIALVILVIAATVWSDRKRWCAAAAGALTGLALAIGFEGLPLLVFCGAAFALRFVFGAEGSRPLRDYGFALAVATLITFVLSVPPGRWMQPVCDTIAINSAAALMIAGTSLALASLFEDRARIMRLVIVAAIGALSAAIFVAIEPRCLGGHYAMVDPAVRPIWLDHVSETQSLLDLIRRATATGLAAAAFPVLAVVAAALILTREKSFYRAFGSSAAVTALAASVGYMIVAARGSSYAVWIGMPFVAAAMSLLFARMKLDNLALRFAALLLVTPTAVTLGTITLASAAGQPELTSLTPPERAGCIAKPNYRALAALPAGRMAINDLEWAPYMLAWTHHSVLAAPYHRLSSSIVLSHRIFAEPQDVARRLAVQAGLTYLVLCGPRGSAGISGEQRQASLLARLQSGHAPNWLQPVLKDEASGFRVWRLKR